MITGISRYKKGKFAQAILDEVYDLAKVKYVGSAAPLPSGVTPMTLKTIWDDSYYPPQQFPCGHYEWGYKYLWRSRMPSASFNPGPSHGHVDWVKSNVYWEICERAIDDKSCARSQNRATNTAIQVAGCSYYYLKNGVWKTLFENRLPKLGSCQNNPPHTGPYKKCTDPDIQAWMDADRHKECHYIDKEGANCYTTHGGGTYPHPWANAITFPNSDTTGITAVCVQQWVRLVQIDKTKDNDFHLAEYVTYCGTDAKNVLTKNVWDITVQGHFRSIAKTGEWVPFGVMEGIPTWNAFNANPPPLCPSTGLPPLTSDTGSRQ